MKTIKVLSLLLCFIAFSFVNESKAQVDVTINPIGLLFGNFNVGADFMISDQISIEPTIGIGYGSTGISGIDSEYKYFSLPVTVFGKYYFNPDDGADKFYADAWLRFVNRSYTYDGDGTTYGDYSQTRFGLGFGIGYKIVANSGLVFDIGFGAGRSLFDKTKFEGEGDDITVDWPNIMFVGKLGIGYRFGGK